MQLHKTNELLTEQLARFPLHTALEPSHEDTDERGRALKKIQRTTCKKMFHTPVECCTEKKIRNKQIFNDTSKRKGWDEVVVLCIIFVKRLYSKHGFFTHNYG